MEITVRMLTRWGACPWGVKRFQKTFGESAKVTRRNLKKARDNDLAVWWLLSTLCERLLTNAGRRALADYRPQARQRFEEKHLPKPPKELNKDPFEPGISQRRSKQIRTRQREYWTAQAEARDAWYDGKDALELLWIAKHPQYMRKRLRARLGG